jgi:hypothetical protein
MSANRLSNTPCNSGLGCKVICLSRERLQVQITYQTPHVATLKVVKSPTKMEKRLRAQATYVFYVRATQLEEE